MAAVVRVQRCAKGIKRSQSRAFGGAAAGAHPAAQLERRQGFAKSSRQRDRDDDAKMRVALGWAGGKKAARGGGGGEGAKRETQRAALGAVQKQEEKSEEGKDCSRRKNAPVGGRQGGGAR